MTATERVASLLSRGIRRELEQLLAVDLCGLGRKDWQLRAAATDAQAGIVAADFPALLGRELDDTARKLAQRAAKRLEATGDIVRLRRGWDGVRVTHL